MSIDIEKITSMSWKITWMSFVVGLVTFIILSMFIGTSSSVSETKGSTEMILGIGSWAAFGVSSMAFTILILAVIANLILAVKKNE